MRKVHWKMLVLAAVAAPIVGQGAAGASQAVDVVSASVGPGALTDTHHAYFRLSLGPGAERSQSIVVRNPNATATPVDIAPVDATTAAGTGATYGVPGSAVRSTGRWITLTERQVQLAPHAERTIGFTVAVPAGTAPGQYLAALSVSVPTAAPHAAAPTGARQAGFAMTLRAQRVIAVEVDVPGPAAPALSVRGATATAQQDMFDLTLALANTGNAFAHGTGTVSVPGTKWHHQFPIGTFVSHTAIALNVPWSRALASGTYPVNVQLDYDGGRIANWSGSVVIDDALRRQVQQGVAGAAGFAPSTSSGTSSLAVGLGVLAVLVVLAVALHLRRHRAELPSSAPESTPVRRGHTVVASTLDQEPTPTAVPVGVGRRD